MKFTFRIFALILAVFATTSLQAQSRKIRALFIGNSYTYANELPAIINNLALADGDTLEFSKNTPGGATLEQHSTNATTLALIAEGNWDFVILQEQSQIPSFPDAYVTSNFFPYVAILDSLIKESNPCATTLMYMTWGRKNGDASNCPSWPPICTYEGMDSLLRLRYQAAADEVEAGISPVGPVWHYIRDEHPGIELYTSDESHPSAAGSFAAACAFYSVIFEKDPATNPYNYTLSTSTAAIIKEAASLIAYDSLSTWMSNVPFAIADFSYETIGDLEVSFVNESEHANSYTWFFGDGNISEDENPIHTYESAGTYEVRLVAQYCYKTDTFSTTIDLGITGLVDEHTEPFKVYPNPVNDLLFVENFGTAERIEMLNTYGQILSITYPVYQDKVTINTSNLAPGLYLVRVVSPSKTSIMNFVKN